MVIKNQKSVLTGEDTHAATLSGSVTVAQNQNVQTGINGSTNGATGLIGKFRINSMGQTMLTLANLVTPANSLMIINTMMATSLIRAGSNSKSMIVQRDGVNIHGPFNLSSSNENSAIVSLNTVALTPVSGTHTYTLVSNDGEGYGGVRMQIIFVNANDTHAATLTGANTRNTRDQGVILG